MEKDKNTEIDKQRAPGIIFVISMVIIAAGLYLLLTVRSLQKPIAGQGGNINQGVQIGGNFELIDQNNEKFNSDQLKGKFSLIYFGFTYCPDICPASLQKITKVMDVLDKYNINVVPIFVTIDPHRDTPPLLKEYLTHFHPRFIGLTGSPEQIKEITDKFKVYKAKANDGNANNDEYMMDHSSFIYFMDKDGKYMKHFYMNSTPEEMIEFIRINAR